VECFERCIMLRGVMVQTNRAQAGQKLPACPANSIQIKPLRWRLDQHGAAFHVVREHQKQGQPVAVLTRLKVADKVRFAMCDI
jgi:hypothetical protein